MTWESYVQMCHELKIEPTKANWHAYLRTALADLKRIMKDAGVKP